MIVVDASVLAHALTDDGDLGRAARDHLASDVHWAAPEHLVVEVFSALRGRWLGGRVSDQRTEAALAALQEAAVDLVTVAPHLPRMWQLRDLSGYDAAYAALAEHLGCPLVTADARLARAPGLRCEVRLAVPRAALP